VAYDRLCELVGVGTSSVSALKTIMTFQIPFVYVHMLAFMVHAVNLLNAVGAGIQIGVSYANGGRLDHGVVGNALVFLILQSFIYQAFLSIGAALSFPVSANAYKIPLSRMTGTLQRQLRTMTKLSFDQPRSVAGSKTNSPASTPPHPP